MINSSYLLIVFVIDRLYFFTGCLNGGGQVKEIITQTSELYASLPVSKPMSNALVKNLYEYIKSKDPNLKYLHTTYKTVPKIEIINPSALKW